MQPPAHNLRYMLWREGVERDSWSEQLATWAHCSVRRAEELLHGAPLYEGEQTALAGSLGISEEELQFASGAHEEDVLLNNLRFLINGLGHGQKKGLAAALNVHPTSISRWCSGEQQPTKNHLNGLIRYFGLPAGTDLQADMVFLSTSPVGDWRKKLWLRQRIERMDSETLRLLFPGLERMLGGR
jgi:transcriptional regulator with XRE-family HTH domain